MWVVRECVQSCNGVGELFRRSKGLDDRGGFGVPGKSYNVADLKGGGSQSLAPCFDALSFSMGSCEDCCWLC